MRFEAEQFTFDLPIEDRPILFEVEYKIAAFILMSLYRRGVFSRKKTACRKKDLRHGSNVLSSRHV